MQTTIIKTSLPKNITNIIEEVKKPMSIREIMNKYGVSSHFEVMVVRDTYFQAGELKGCLAMEAGSIIRVYHISDECSNAVEYTDQDGYERALMDIDSKKFAYSDKK